MKIFELLNSLTPEDKKALKRTFFSVNKQLSLLWEEIHSISESEFQENKGKLFRKVLGKPMNESSEKQLKNLLTELFHLVRGYIGDLWLQGTENVELNKCINYLNTLGLRQANDLFEKEWNYYFNQFSSSLYYFGLSKLYFVKYSQTIRNPKMYQEAIECLKTSYKYNQMAYLEESANLSYTALNFNYFKEIYGIDEVLSMQTFELLKEETISSFSNPIDKAIQLIEEKKPQVKWGIVLEIFTLLINEKSKYRPSIKFKLGQSIFNYAIMLIYEEELDKAEEIFLFIEKNELIKHAVANETVFYFNYSSLLLKKGQFEKALAYQQRVMGNMEHVPMAKKTQFLIREKYLQILNNQYDDIYTTLSELQPHLFKEDQMLYVRALIIIYLIDTNDLESAYRECENSKRMQHFNSELAKDESDIINFICKLLSFQLKEKISKVKFNKIHRDILESRVWTKSSNLLKIWLEKYLAKLNAKMPDN
ncbi:MAG: hypothetical protein JNL75_06225 [Chitinophagales bacterium]|nr:hypothetical protein [Chitinophagales bacterium]